MTRDITASATTASQSDVVRPFLMAKLEYTSATIYVCTADRNIVYAGNTYMGVGGFGRVSDFEESIDLQASYIDLTLSGVDSANISQALSENYQGRTATVYLGLHDANYALISDPVVLFKGKMDTQTIVLGEEGVITLRVQNQMADWNRPRVRRYNNDDQRNRYPNDKGLEFVEQMVNKSISWGR